MSGSQLARMREVARRARQAGHGVLWGTGICPKDVDRPLAVEPPWIRHNDGAAIHLARTMRDTGRFADLPVLADALEDAGCASAEIQEHCRLPGGHIDCCWVVDRIAALGPR